MSHETLRLLGFRGWLNWLDTSFNVSPCPKHVIQSMEGFRGVGCILVFLAHYCIQFNKHSVTDPALADLTRYVRHAGELALDLFFLMSGYLIYGILMKKQISCVSYLQRRIVRIYPTFVFVFSVYLLLFAVFPERSKLPGGLPTSLFYVAQNLLLLPGILDIKPIVSVAWTLSYELSYYLLAPLVINLCCLRQATTLQRLLFLVVFSIVALASFNLVGGHIRMMAFVAGIIVFELHRHTRFRVPKYTGVLAVGVAYIVQVLWHERGLSPGLIGVVAYCCYIAFGVDCFVQSGTDAIFRIKLFRWIGNLSYSFYLTHTLVIHSCLAALAFAFPGSFTRGGFFTIWFPLLVMAVLVGGITFQVVEKPFSLSTRRSLAVGREMAGSVTARPEQWRTG